MDTEEPGPKKPKFEPESNLIVYDSIDDNIPTFHPELRMLALNKVKIPLWVFQTKALHYISSNVAAFSYKQMLGSGKSVKIKVLDLDNVQRKLKSSGIGIPYEEDSIAFHHWDEAALNLICFKAEHFEKGLQAA
ncbi:hypothetical protein GYMLUDRAFT_246095 [Collybiopsis luxurians FD-317 M1]|uniref:Uncharacterized protein n=1 Tax=Collybiopsis luxurians FD-317 M1 TaxID=944289 RepID=A0A0D0B4W8_9AGAR|nr:hypothetical protein GYMLUDRAFT_246095 [Collybiopsis luxurians FD-317 M1]